MFLLLFTLFFSCKKSKHDIIPTGNYIGNFYGHTVKAEDGTYSEFEKNDLNVPLEIKEISETSIMIGHLTQYRSGNIIEGPIDVGNGSGGYYLSPLVRGLCTKEKGEYFIRGSYNAVNTVGGSVSGTFEIKSDF